MNVTQFFKSLHQLGLFLQSPLTLYSNSLPQSQQLFHWKDADAADEYLFHCDVVHYLIVLPIYR
jgi:hypothetical protein